MARVNMQGVGLPVLEVRQFGNWVQTENAINRLGPSIRKGYEVGATKAMRKLERVIKRSILSSMPPPNSGVQWQPLAQSTINRYGNHGIYRMTMTYYRAIRLRTTRGGNIICGVDTNRKHPTHGKLTIVKIANILEGGTQHIPSRPLWAPAFRSIGGRPYIKREIIKSVRSELIKSGFRANQVKVTRWL